MNVTSKAMRTIDKKGGFDQYLLNTPDKLLSPGGVGRGVDLKRQLLAVLQEAQEATEAAEAATAAAVVRDADTEDSKPSDGEAVASTL